MNIFALSRIPSECARFHNNKHCSKMILEHAQMLCTTLHEIGITVPYRPVHRKHPCTLWVKENRSNFLWLCQMSLYLGDEFNFRFKNNHKSIEVIKYCLQFHRSLPEGDLPKFALAMPDDYKVECPVQSYRNYYNNDKRHLADWGPREIPSWYKL
jgi:hypothetical protein